MKYLKIIKLLVEAFAFKQVGKQYESEFEGRAKPLVLKRRFLGTVAVSVSSIAILLGAEAIDVELLVKHLLILRDAGFRIYDIIMEVKVSVMFIWGVALIIYGAVRSNIERRAR